MTSGNAIGLDVGGTTLKAVRVDAAGHVLRATTLPAGGAITRDALLAAVDRAIAELGGLDGVGRLGIAVGSVVAADGSLSADATNLPNFVGIALPPLFTERFDRPCTVINDAHAAMHGEACFGAARGLSNALMITFGTGIGSALLLDGRVRAGPHGTAGEIGTWPVRGHDFVQATFEELAAPVRFERRFRRPLTHALLAAPGDVLGAAVLATIGRVLAAAHMLLDLEAILLGGGIAAVGEPLRASIEVATREACPSALWHDMTVKLSALGPYAGAIGAVAPTVPGART